MEMYLRAQMNQQIRNNRRSQFMYTNEDIFKITPSVGHLIIDILYFKISGQLTCMLKFTAPPIKLSGSVPVQRIV